LGNTSGWIGKSLQNSDLSEDEGCVVSSAIEKRLQEIQRNSISTPATGKKTD